MKNSAAEEGYQAAGNPGSLSIMFLLAGSKGDEALWLWPIYSCA